MIPESANRALRFLFDPACHILINVLPMAYPEDINHLSFDLEDNAIISHTKLPIPSKVLA